MMVHVQINAGEMDTLQYYHVLGELENRLNGFPEKRLFHVCFMNNGQLNISEIWETQEDFMEYCKKFRIIAENMNMKTDNLRCDTSEVENFILYRINYDNLRELRSA